MTNKNISQFITWIALASLSTCAFASIDASKLQEVLNTRTRREISQGIVIGIFSPSGTQFMTSGQLSASNATPISENSIFEIAGLSNIFTAAAVSQQVSKKQLSWFTSIVPLFPETAKIPKWNGKPIRLHDLASHSAGLPRLYDPKSNPGNSNPYDNYKVNELYNALNRYALPYEPGQIYAYSDIGYGLLGHALELKLNKPFGTILSSELAPALGLVDTTTKLTPQQESRLTLGHQGITEQPSWDYGVLAGCGGIYSTPKDLLRFIALNLQSSKDKALSFLKLTQLKRLETNIPNTMSGYGWFITHAGNDTFFWQNGLTSGYSTFFGFNLATQTGTVVLSNSGISIDDIGFHILAPSSYEFPTPPKPFPMSAKTLKRYNGSYKLGPELHLEVSSKGGRLYAKTKNKPTYRIYPISKTEFAYPTGQQSIKFKIDKKQRATGLIYIDGFQRYSGTRL